MRPIDIRTLFRLAQFRNGNNIILVYVKRDDIRLMHLLFDIYWTTVDDSIKNRTFHWARATPQESRRKRIGLSRDVMLALHTNQKRWRPLWRMKRPRSTKQASHMGYSLQYYSIDPGPGIWDLDMSTDRVYAELLLPIYMRLICAKIINLQFQDWIHSSLVFTCPFAWWGGGITLLWTCLVVLSNANETLANAGLSVAFRCSSVEDGQFRHTSNMIWYARGLLLKGVKPLKVLNTRPAGHMRLFYGQ